MLQSRQVLLDSPINEGLADSFAEQLFGRPSPWARALSLKACRRVFNKLRPRLHDRSLRLYREVFFGSKRYRTWTGYSIGYQIIKTFLKKNPNREWKDIIEMRPKEIFKRSGW